MAAPKRRGRPRKEESAAKNTSENKKTAAKSATAKKTTAKKPSASAKKTLKPQGDTVFALDIGTRTVVGILGFMDGETFRVTDTESVPHLKRAMIDGQVEDIEQVAKVARTVKETLEQRNSIRLTEVSVAAAGRALKTYRVSMDFDVSDKNTITADMVRTMECETIQKAQKGIDEKYSNEEMFKEPPYYSKVAESVMIAGMFCAIAPEYVEMCKMKGDTAEAEKAQAEIEKMRKNTLEYGYDGEWFLRAYDHYGKKVGSHECEEGKIFIEPQGWCVLAGLGKDKGYDIQTLDSVDKYLNSKHGLVLNNPAFTHYYIQYGEISTYPGGYKENAGIFCHNNAWIICAEAAVGRGDKAFEYYSKIAPAFREDISDLHRTEPYVYAQMIAGKDAKRHGEAKNSWLTGTAAWNFVAVSQYILGIKPEYNGLKIDPSIPHEWDGFTASRLFRGATYEITVKNPDHVCHGVKSVTVDGKAVDSNVIPVFENGTHKVEVVLG